MKCLVLAIIICLGSLLLPSCKKSDNNKESVRLMSELIQERDAKLKIGLQADEIIGSWQFSLYQMGGTLTIYKKDNQYFCYTVYSDGSKGIKNLSKEGDKYYLLDDGERTSYGGYYEVSSDGLLNVFDDDGNLGWDIKIAIYPSV